MGALLVLISAAAFGAMAIFGKLAFNAGVDVPDLLLARFTLATAALMLVAVARGASALVASDVVSPAAIAVCRAAGLPVIGDVAGLFGWVRPGDLLAVVPHLLGFVPRSSLVVMGTAPPRDRIRVTLRYDLPDPPGAGIAADIAAHIVGVVGSQQLTAMTAVGYGPEVLVDPVAYALRDAARQAGIDLRDVLRVEDGRYWSYACGDEACCPAAGTPFDPAASSAAAGSSGSMVAGGPPSRFWCSMRLILP